MIMPSMVNMKRVLLARKLSTASRTTSLNIMVDRALARVRSKEVGLDGVTVAIEISYQLDVYQYRSGAGFPANPLTRFAHAEECVSG